MIEKIKMNRKLKIALTSVMAVCVVLGTLGLVKAAETVPTNIAPKAWAQADVTSDVNYHADFVGNVENLNDGTNTNQYKYGFYKRMDANDKVYLTFDDTYMVSEVSVDFHSDREAAQKYELSLWDGSKWVKAGDDTTDEGDGTYLRKWTFDSAKTCTAMRLTFTKHTTAGALWIEEIRVMGVKSSEKLARPVILTNTMNMAYQAAVTFSPEWEDMGWNTSFPVGEMVDNITMTGNNYVCTKDLGQNDRQEVDLILEKSSLADEIVLYPAIKAGDLYDGGFPEDFTIEVYNGKEWVKIADEKGQSVGAYGAAKADVKEKAYEFEPMDISAVRIVVTKQGATNANGTTFAFRLGEIQVNGVKSSKTVPKPGEEAVNDVNAALNGAVEMNVAGFALSSLPATNLVDGTSNFTTTEYSTKTDTAEEAAVIFKDGAYTINKIVLAPRIKNNVACGFPVDFQVSVWNGTDWVKVAEKTGYVSGTAALTLDITPTVCNAVKIEVTKMGVSDNESLPFVFQLAELEAWGSKSDAVIATPGTGGDSGETPGGGEDQNTGVNAALNGTVEMNVAGFAQSSLPATNLVDGTGNFTTTEYSTKADIAEEAAVIFKDGTYTINKIVLVPRIKNNVACGFPVDFKVSVWNGTAWVKVAEKTGYVSGTAALSLDITPTVCNAVKIEVTKMGVSDNESLPYVFQLAELEAWGEKSSASLAKPSVGDGDASVTEKGTNAALQGAVTMNVPTWAASFPGSKLVDGVTKGDNNFATTEYVAEAGTKESIIIVFKEGAYTIDKVKLYPRIKGNAYNGGFPVDFTVSVWNGTKWVQVAARTGVNNKGETMSLEITPSVCNALKIEVTKLGESENKGQYTLQLAEIEAYGEKSSRSLDTPPVSGGSSGSAATSTGQVTIDNTKNLALNRPVKASSDLAQYNAPITKVNDGEIGSYWASSESAFVKGEAQWAEVNLLNNFAIDTVILGARQQALGFPIDFKIEVFYDGEWKIAHTVTGFEADEKAGYTAYEFKFPAVIGNKVRISSDNFRKVGTSNSMVLSEIAVYGSAVSGNYVLPNENMITIGAGITTTTSMEDYDYYMLHLVDGKLTTGWSSVPSVTNDAQTIEIDMKGEVQLSEIQLKPSWGGHGFPIDFTISVYDNGEWLDVYKAVDYEKPEDEAIQRFQFETRKVTKFRITATKMDREAGLYVFKLNEIMAYPSHTGDEFDPDRVEEVKSSEKLVAAEVLSPDEKNASGDEKVDIQVWKIIVGGILIIVAAAGCAAMFILSGKKKK